MDEYTASEDWLRLGCPPAAFSLAPAFRRRGRRRYAVEKTAGMSARPLYAISVSSSLQIQNIFLILQAELYQIAALPFKRGDLVLDQRDIPKYLLDMVDRAPLSAIQIS